MKEHKATLYRDVILDHARQPRNAGRLERPDLAGSAVNALCGDEAHVTLVLRDGAIGAIGMQVRGCVISQAAASLVSECVRAKTLAEVADLEREFRAVMEGTGMPGPGGGRGSSELPPRLAALQPLVDVKQHRSRIGCTLLPWQALLAVEPAAHS